MDCVLRLLLAPASIVDALHAVSVGGCYERTLPALGATTYQWYRLCTRPWQALAPLVRAFYLQACIGCGRVEHMTCTVQLEDPHVASHALSQKGRRIWSLLQRFF